MQNDLETDSGNILFGGIDTQKFIGELEILQLLPEDNASNKEIVHFNVQIDGFNVKTSGDAEFPSSSLDELNSLAILDSGSTISLLPDAQVQALWEHFNVLSFPDVLAPFIDCAYGGEKGDGYVFEFRFDGKTIKVPMEEMVIDAYGDLLEYLSVAWSTRQCLCRSLDQRLCTPLYDGACCGGSCNIIIECLVPCLVSCRTRGCPQMIPLMSSTS